MNHSRNKDYYEYLAKLILEKYYSESYHNLEISDRPDLKTPDGNGVEVTQAMFDGAGQAGGKFKSIKMKNINQISIKEKDAFEKHGYKLLVVNEIVCGYIPPAQWFSLKEIQECFEEKLHKLKNYQATQKIDLFIFSPLFDYYEPQNIEAFCNWCQTKQEEESRKFRYVFIFDYTNIYKCELEKRQIEKKECAEASVHQCCVDAKAFADKEERCPHDQLRFLNLRPTI